MRQLITFLISTIAIWNVLLAAAPTTDQHMQDYYLGLAVGECFAAGCQIFRGTLLTYPPKPGDNVDVHVEEVLLGPPLTEDTVELPYQDLAPLESTKPALRMPGDGSSRQRTCPSWRCSRPMRGMARVVGSR